MINIAKLGKVCIHSQIGSIPELFYESNKIRILAYDSKKILVVIG